LPNIDNIDFVLTTKEPNFFIGEDIHLLWAEAKWSVRYLRFVWVVYYNDWKSKNIQYIHFSYFFCNSLSLHISLTLSYSVRACALGFQDFAAKFLVILKYESSGNLILVILTVGFAANIAQIIFFDKKFGEVNLLWEKKFR
jgi:hypothetical protein